MQEFRKHSINSRLDTDKGFGFFSRAPLNNTAFSEKYKLYFLMKKSLFQDNQALFQDAAQCSQIFE
jgi:hypothetical protein